MQPLYEAEDLAIYHGDCRDVLASLPAESVDVCVTSPPYWQKRVYKNVSPSTWADGWHGCLGLESTPDQFVAHVAEVFDAVWRVLKPTGSCWVNLADTYIGGGHGPTGKTSQLRDKAGRDLYEVRQGFVDQAVPQAGLTEKSLAAIPERFVLAMMGRGWVYREPVVWEKVCHMPEAVVDRCTTAHEPIYHFTRQAHYFADMTAVRVAGSAQQTRHNQRYAREYSLGLSEEGNGQPGNVNHVGLHARPGPGGHNLGSVWRLGPEPSRAGHYAAYPREVARRPILMSTSEQGNCPACGAPWRRLVEPTEEYAKALARANDQGDWYARSTTVDVKQATGSKHGNFARGISAEYVTTGWAPTCKHADLEPVPAVCLDPFVGSGTTLLVARQLGRRGIGVDASLTYLTDIAIPRLTAQTPALPGLAVA